jgi:general secretion pathway protein G
VVIRVTEQPMNRSGERRLSGFTLIELLVVLAILAMMMTLAVPRYYSQLDASRETVLRENLRTVREMLDRFHGDKGRYPEALQELVDLRYLGGLPVDPMTESSATWIIEPPPPGYRGEVFNIRSGSTAIGKNGKAYAEW